MAHAELDEDTLNDLREDLERQRAELVNKSKLASNQVRETDQMQGGRDSIDESTEEQGTSTMLRLADRERNLLAKINAALDRIADGEYGYCEACGEEINVKRLKARPVTDMCIECKSEQEREEARHRVRPGLLDEYE